MGTEKRERQRTNKAMKEQQQARAQTRQRSTRMAIIVIGAIVAVFAIAFAANTFIGDDDEPENVVEVTPATVAAGAAAGDDLPADVPADDVPADDVPATDPEAPVQEGAIDEATGEFIPDGCPPPEGTAEQTQTFEEQPPICLDPNVSYRALVATNKGEITIELDQAKAPGTVNNFVFLARNQYFDDTICHRIIPGFVVQCGDPDGTGRGGPGYDFGDELPSAGEYQIGSIAMANSGPNTNGSQFFIITGDSGVALPPAYSLFGEVATGYEETVVVMEAAGTPSGNPSEPIEINTVTIQVT